MSFINYLVKKTPSDKVVLKVNGVEVPVEGNNITIEMSGTLGNIKVVCVGEVVTLTSNTFDIFVEGNTGNVSTSQGDITCKDVTGYAKTSQGDINCGNVTGNVKTSMGDIKYKK